MPARKIVAIRIATRMGRIKWPPRVESIRGRKNDRMALRQRKGQKFDSTGYNNLCSKTVSSLFAHAFSNSRKKRRIHPQKFDSQGQDRIAMSMGSRCAKPTPPTTNALYNSPEMPRPME